VVSYLDRVKEMQICGQPHLNYVAAKVIHKSSSRNGIREFHRNSSLFLGFNCDVPVRSGHRTAILFMPRSLVKPSRVLFLSALLISASVAFSQTPQDWIPQALHSLGQNATSRTEFSLDHSMLVLASKLDQDDQDLRRVIAGVDGVSVHEFRFHGAATYDPEALNAVVQEYHAAGWKRLVNNHSKNGYPGETDLWLHFENNAVRKIAILHAGESQIDFVEVSGSISPLDLLHLAGHFGIPKIEGGVVLQGQNGGQ